MWKYYTWPNVARRVKVLQGIEVRRIEDATRSCKHTRRSSFQVMEIGLGSSRP